MSLIKTRPYQGQLNLYQPKRLIKYYDNFYELWGVDYLVEFKYAVN
ncbi:hypothetical protein AVV30_gp092 [Vibrio phage phi 1]|uniref:Uncharacterized protein n=1 Tax=Vibrio phage phi 1 TaxID=1589297 RepID=A0A0B5HE27_9CAUD|nr:hypothetical protein AVV30_gp092 [Vibrio phage phi 1]AJF40750.1 hypothetical protein SBVP1_0092 [Vibrio phage phi 1]